MSRETEQQNRRMLRARDTMDRQFADELDVPSLARIAHVSPAPFIRTFRATFGESPKAYRAAHPRVDHVPTHFAMAWTRPSSFGEAHRRGRV